MTFVDTGSSDLWVVSDACKAKVCINTNMPRYPSASIKPAGGPVNLRYGDSLTGTHASGTVAQDVAAIAGLSMSQQVFVAVWDTNITAVMYGANGIFGLGFPGGRCVMNDQFCRPCIYVQRQPSASCRHQRKGVYIYRPTPGEGPGPSADLYALSSIGR
jgi:hypothetical protein